MISDLKRRTNKTAATMRKAAEGMGMFITADDRISERDAALLLGYEQASLRNLRTAGGGPDFFNRPLGGYAKSYRLDDLAHWIERSREVTI